MSRAGAVLLALAVALAGAEGGSCRADREVDVRLVRASERCGPLPESGAAVSARRLGSAEELASVFPPELGAPSPQPALADFDAEVVVVIATGEKPTAGWALALAAPKAQVKDGVAGVSVAVAGPAAGAITAQVLTRPCLVVALPAKGLGAVAVLEGQRAVATVPLR
jgi:hypothetical protein